MRVVFMGTPDFAVGSLQALAESGKYDIAAVVTQPDRPKGRGRKIVMSPVKEYALMHAYEVYQPERIKNSEFVEVLRRLSPDIIVVAAFGQLLSKDILDLPRYGCINVHASLLPKYRGAAPIQYAIINGEKETGVTIMQMDVGMDTGAMLGKIRVAVGENMTLGELHDELRDKGAELLLDVMGEIERGSAVAEPQDSSAATYARMLDRSMEKIDWHKPVAELHNYVRGFDPAPGMFTLLPDGRSIKLFSSRVSSLTSSCEPGTVVAVSKRSFCVACGDGVLEFLEVQPESKKRIESGVFLNGRGVRQGDILGRCRVNDGSDF